jgi:hypothetical protein
MEGHIDYPTICLDSLDTNTLFLQEKAVETTKQKGAMREKLNMPKPEEHEGLPLP